jgi:NAD-dependent SIR2 family protein deacetylase
MVRRMVEAQGFSICQESDAHFTGSGESAACEKGEKAGTLLVPEGKHLSMTIPTELVPHCPKCGRPMSMNLRSDNTFVEDEGWHVHAGYYSEFLRRHQNVKTLFLELGVGYNTPGIIKFNFWKMTHEWPDATYACLNFGEAYAPDEIIKKSICINDDTATILEKLGHCKDDAQL